MREQEKGTVTAIGCVDERATTTTATPIVKETAPKHTDSDSKDPPTLLLTHPQ